MRWGYAGNGAGDTDWVIDLDVQKFFDSCPHDLIVKAVEANTAQRWIVLYVKRWLVAPLQHADGSLQARERGTPQGSAVSPCLASLFLHYAFDRWMAREFPSVRFERYVDDAVVHCVSERQALAVKEAIAARMAQVGLNLHPDKTKIVYCRDSNRRGEHDAVTFDFLGYTFRPRAAVNKRTGAMFTSFAPAMSRDKLTAKGEEVRAWRLHLRTGGTLADLADQINPVVRGWMTVLGSFQQVPDVWPAAAHQRLPDALGPQEIPAAPQPRRLEAWWERLVTNEPGMFAHWAWVTGCGPAFAGR